MHWYEIAQPDDAASPALLVYPHRIAENIRRMVAIAGDPARLVPHVKTHKMPEIVRLQLAAGIHKFKCATIAEAEMTARAGAADVLVAYPPVGPSIGRLVRLAKTFPQTAWSVAVDDAAQIARLDEAAAAVSQRIHVLVDIDVGMHRTGRLPDESALALYRQIAAAKNVRPGGLHAYDGHQHQADLADAAGPWTRPSRRCCVCATRCWPPACRCRGSSPEEPSASPSMRGAQALSSSPGTPLLWDHGYTSSIPDLDFLPAAILLTRVISKPGSGRLCLDCGHKALSPDRAGERIYFPELPDARMVGQSEEHLVVETAAADNHLVGDVLYGIPWHICPTVALHSEAVVVEEGRVVDRWRVAARDRRLTI